MLLPKPLWPMLWLYLPEDRLSAHSGVVHGEAQPQLYVLARERVLPPLLNGGGAPDYSRAYNFHAIQRSGHAQHGVEAGQVPRGADTVAGRNDSLMRRRDALKRSTISGVSIFSVT